MYYKVLLMCNLGEPQNLAGQNVEDGRVVDWRDINVEDKCVAALQVAGEREACIWDQLHVQHKAVLVVLRSIVHVTNLKYII